MTIHELKTWPEPFEQLLAGVKTHEIRRCRKVGGVGPPLDPEERVFEAGDLLVLREWKAAGPKPDASGGYTGRIALRVVTLVTSADWGIPDGLAVMSIRPVWPEDVLKRDPSSWAELLDGPLGEKIAHAVVDIFQEVLQVGLQRGDVEPAS